MGHLCDRKAIPWGEIDPNRKPGPPLFNLVSGEADAIIRSRIERLADKILNATDEAGAKDGMTAAEVVGVLEMCKAEVINKAYEVIG